MALRDRFHPLWLCAALIVALNAAPAGATSMIGGEQLNPGEQAHEAYIGFPYVGYQYSFKASGKRTIGLQADVIVWPLTFHVALATKTLMGIQGRAVTSFRFEPGVLFSLYGGSRAVYQNLRWGRTKNIDLRMAPVLNVGVSSSIDLGKSTSLVLGLESPFAVWFLLSQVGWWVEWPILLDVGLEFDVSFRSTLFVKGALGPSLGFTGTQQFAGVAFQFAVGIQTLK